MHLYFLPDIQIPATAFLITNFFDYYDQNEDKRLSARELGLNAGQFKSFDKNRDQHWSKTELSRWLDSPAHLNIHIQFDESDPARHKLSIQPARKASSFEMTRLNTGAYIFPSSKDQIEIMLHDGLNKKLKKLRSRLRTKFLNNSGGDGVLNSKEIYRPPFDWMGVFRLADRNVDDRLSLKEIEAYEKLVDQATAAVTGVLIVDRSPSLFEMLDIDHSGTLSLREMNGAWNRLQRWDENKDKAIVNAELPWQSHMVLGQGITSEPTKTASLLGYGPAHKSYQPQRGPLWFRKMDINNDGDVSLREFLGSEKVFRQIDRDGDGLIDAEEAAKLVTR